VKLSAAAKATFAGFVRYTGLPMITRVTIARRRVGIIVYHDPPPERLENHLDYLVRRYEMLTLDELVEAITTRRWGQRARPGIVITFDDGHRGNTALTPIFERYRLRPVVYLATQSVATGRFWFLEPGIDPEPLKLLPTAGRLARIEAEGTGSATDRQALDPDEVQGLTEHVDFGSHTVTHPILPLCDDDEAAAEIRNSRRDVERLTGRPCAHFSYPNGDYGARDVLLVRGSGYTSARTADIGWVGPTTDPFRLPIVSLADHASVNMLAAHLAGALAIKRAVRRSRRALSRSRRPPTLEDRGIAHGAS
jgi:peptidoglycan/xylan/chitin deacetylase (PgdA/CDA1 family)